MEISKYLGHLPSLPVEHRQYLPKISAIYIVADNTTCIYVGRTNNLRLRWSEERHHRLLHVMQFDDAKIHWIEVAESALPHVEAAMIKLLNPALNDTRRDKFLEIYWRDKTKKFHERLGECDTKQESDLVTALFFDEFQRAFVTPEQLANICVKRGFDPGRLIQALEDSGAIPRDWDCNDDDHVGASNDSDRDDLRDNRLSLLSSPESIDVWASQQCADNGIDNG